MITPLGARFFRLVSNYQQVPWLARWLAFSARSLSGDEPILSNPLDTATQKAILINTIGNFGGNKLGAMMKEIPVFPMMSKWGEAAGQTITNIPANLLTQTPKSK